MTGRLRFIEYFRAVAILHIVLGHMYPFAGLPWHMLELSPADTFPGDFLLSLTDGGSNYFLFISGFLFSYVFAARFDYRGFLLKKFYYVGLPYLIFSTALFIFHARHGHIMLPDNHTAVDLDTNNVFYIFGTYVLTGYNNVAYWYIPFIFLIFLASPMFLLFERAKPRQQVAVLVLTFILTMLVHRSPGNLNPVHNFFFYVFFYCLGIFCAVHRDRFCRIVSRPWVVIGSAAIMVALSYLQSRYGVPGMLQAPPFTTDTFDFMSVQRVFGIVMFSGLLLQFENRPPIRWLEVVADYSFGIFFLHVVFIKLVANSPIFELLHEHSNVWLKMFSTGAMAVLFSMALVWVARRLINGRSRYIVGS